MDTYDEKLRMSENIKFYPYVGAEYASTMPKILILGHSHYANCDGSPTQMQEWDKDESRTRTVILDDYLATLRDNKTHPYRWVRCYRYMAATLTGEGYHDSDYIWEKLAFTNFFQKHIGISPRDRQFFSVELLESSRRAFWENLQILQPNYVIVWGHELYNYCLPRQNFIEIKCTDKPSQNSISPLIGYYQNFPKIIFWKMKHPAQGISPEVEHQKWKNILEVANQT